MTLPQEMKRKTRRNPKRSLATQSAASEEEALKSVRAISLSGAFEYLDKGISGNKASSLHRASRRPGQKAPRTARTATIHVDAEGTVLSAVQKKFTMAWKAGKYVGEHFGFGSPAALCRAITAERWELLARLQQIGPMEIRALARLLDRGSQRIRDDLAELIRIGLVERTTHDRVWVPFQEIRTYFVLRR